MDIKVPQLAEGVESATVANIVVSEGDRIEKDQVIVELETEKAVGPIPSPQSGVVAKIHVKQGDQVSVGQVLISLTEAGAEAEKAEPEEKAERPAEKVSGTEEAGRQKAAAQPAQERQALSYRYASESGLPPPAPPSLRKIARDLGIDLTRVRGSERGGRIALADVRAYIRQLQRMAFEKPAPPEKAPGPAPKRVDFSQWGPTRKEPLSSVRRTIGQRMHEAWSTIPHITQFDEADITALWKLKEKYDAAYEKKKAPLTLTALALKAVVATLKRYPAFNASLDETADELVYKDYYHIGVAVDSEAGLIVPVLRDVDKKDLVRIAKDLGELVERTRKRKVSLEELQGGSFTISNQGSLGGAHFTPIIHKPEAAILGLGRSQMKPVVRENKVVARRMLPVCLSYDHRVVDGADAVRFVRDFIQALENFKEEEIKPRG